MKALIPITIVALVLAGCAPRSPLTVFEPGGDAVVFTVRRIFIDSFQIGLRRTAGGVIELEAYRLGYSGGVNGRTELLSRTTLDSAAYAEIVAYVDGAALEALHAEFPPPGADGWTWELSRMDGARHTLKTFWCPEHHRYLRGSKELLSLGERLVQLAGIEQQLRAFGERPNQSMEPTATAVTPRADARGAPAVAVAHH